MSKGRCTCLMPARYELIVETDRPLLDSHPTKIIIDGWVKGKLMLLLKHLSNILYAVL